MSAASRNAKLDAILEQYRHGEGRYVCEDMLADLDLPQCAIDRLLDDIDADREEQPYSATAYVSNEMGRLRADRALAEHIKRNRRDDAA